MDPASEGFGHAEMRCPVSIFRGKAEVPMTRIEVAF
jgi:hypothetical protein